MSNEMMSQLITYGPIVAMGLIFYFMICHAERGACYEGY